MTFPKQTEVEVPLLREIEAMGGEAKPQEELLQKVAARFPQITKADLGKKSNAGKRIWKSRVRSASWKLRKKGYLERLGGEEGLWRITEAGKTYLLKPLSEGTGAPPPPEPPKIAPPVAPSSGEPNKLAEEITSLVEKLAELAKKRADKEPLLSHDELVQKVKEMGEMLGKTVEVKWGPVYKPDCVWKDNPYANPKLVMEVCDKGNLDKDIASLLWANTNWGAKGVLVTFEESDFQAARKKLAPGSQIYPMKAEDMVKLHYLLQAGNVLAVRLIFGI